MKTIFVSPYKGVWSIRYEGDTDVLTLCDTSEEAIEEAKFYASSDNNEIIILRSDGSIDSIVNKQNEFP